MLSGRRKCKRDIVSSGDFGMDQYVSWSLSTEELTLDTIWEKFEEFCKPQSNEARARFDTSFWQGNQSVDEWYNAVQTQVALAKYPPETAKILYRDIFWFFLKDEEFVSKTINDNNIDQDKFPASKVRQLAKKWKAQRWPAVTSNRWQVTPRWHKLIWCGTSSQTSQQANTSISLMWNLDHPVTRMMQITGNQCLHSTTITVLIQRMFTRSKRDVRNVAILYM